MKKGSSVCMNLLEKPNLPIKFCFDSQLGCYFFPVIVFSFCILQVSAYVIKR